MGRLLCIPDAMIKQTCWKYNARWLPAGEKTIDGKHSCCDAHQAEDRDIKGT